MFFVVPRTHWKLFCAAALFRAGKSEAKKTIRQDQIEKRVGKFRTERQRAKRTALPAGDLKERLDDSHKAAAFRTACGSNVAMKRVKVNKQIKGEKNTRKEKAVLEQAISLNCLFSIGKNAEIGLFLGDIQKWRFWRFSGAQNFEICEFLGKDANFHPTDALVLVWRSEVATRPISKVRLNFGQN